MPQALLALAQRLPSAAVLGLRRFVRLAKRRWRIELDYRELEDELGLDYFEGRPWTGWHHHVTVASLAFAFLMLERQRGKKTPAMTVPGTPQWLQALLLRLGEWCPDCGCPWRMDSSQTQPGKTRAGPDTSTTIPPAVRYTETSALPRRISRSISTIS